VKRHSRRYKALLDIAIVESLSVLVYSCLCQSLALIFVCYARYQGFKNYVVISKIAYYVEETSQLIETDSEYVGNIHDAEIFLKKENKSSDNIS